MARRVRVKVLLVVAMVAIMLDIQVWPPADATAQAGCRRFDQTGHTLCGRFLQYWQQHGGLEQQGYPVSEPFSEMSDTDDKIYTVQYFERAVFEMHPENRPPNDVLLALLGSFRYKEKYPGGATKQVPNTEHGSQFFPQTGKRLGGTLLSYWQSHGGLAQQGYPISDEFLETSATDGKVYKVQYFERAVFELHPEKQAPYDVLLSLLGTFRLRDKHGDGSSLPPAPAPPVESGGLGLSRAAWEKIHGAGGEGGVAGIAYRGGYMVAFSSGGPDGLVAAIYKFYDPKVSMSSARAETKTLLPADAQPLKLNEIDRNGAQIYNTYDTYLSPSLSTLFPPGTPKMFGESNGPDIWNGAQPGTLTIKYDPTPNNDGANTVSIFIYVGGRN